MESVAFITCESGVDIIVSFAVCNPSAPTEIESLTILRTPKYEHFLPAEERGASVSFDRENSSEEEPSKLKEVIYYSEGKSVVLVTNQNNYELDVSKTSSSELRKMCNVFRRMNHDSSIRLVGI